MAQNPHLQWALAEIREPKREKRYLDARKYYAGDHPMLFAAQRFTTVFGEKFQATADNLCPAIVDSIADRLIVTGVGTNATEESQVDDGNGNTRTRVTDPIGSHAWRVWNRNRMPMRSSEVHREALLTGDGYVIVWQDPRGRAAIWPQVAHEMAVLYSEEIPGLIDVAARVWTQRDGRLRINLFYPDRTERYQSRQAPLRPSTSWIGKAAQTLLGRAASAVGVADFEELGVIQNTFGRVPVFHFSNMRLYAPGISELRDVMPLQDALNKAVCDMIVAMEFAAYRQRWAVGLEVDTDETGKPKAPPFQPGPDRIFAAEDKETKFGEFSETNLTQFLEVQESLRSEIARVSGVPLHYLFITRGDFPSGEAMKSAEARFSRKIMDRQGGYGSAWDDALQFALKIEADLLPKTPPEDFEISVGWESGTPRSEEELARTIVLKQNAGVSRRQGLKELGYSDDDIEEMLAEEPDQPTPAPDLTAGA